MLAMQSTTTIQVHPAMPVNFAVSPTMGACSFATSDGQSYVATAVQPAAGAPQGIQHVLLPSPTVLSQAAPGGATAVRCAIPIQGVTPLSPPAATMTTYTCPIPGQQQPLAMTGVRPVLVPAAPAAAAGAAPGVSSPIQSPVRSWPSPFSADSLASTPSSVYSFQDSPHVMQRYSPYLLADGPGRMPKRARDCTRLLREWLIAHRHNPYPQKADKCQLMLMTGLTINQVSMWFANARRRIKKVGMKAWSKGLCEDLPGTGSFENESDEEEQTDVASDDMAMNIDSDCAGNESPRRYSCPAKAEAYAPDTIPENGHVETTAMAARAGRSFSCNDVEHARRAIILNSKMQMDAMNVEFSPATTPQSSSGVADKWSSSSGYATNDTPGNGGVPNGQHVVEQEQEQKVQVTEQAAKSAALAQARRYLPPLMPSVLMSAPSLIPNVPWCLRPPAESNGLEEVQEES